MDDIEVPTEVWFDASVMTSLRFPGWIEEDEGIGLEEAREQYREELVERYQMAVFADQETADWRDTEPPPLPHPVLTELESVSAELRRLEVYRDQLMIFCRNLSADPETARAIAAATGMSHTTVLRTGTTDDLAAVVAVAKPVAEAMLGWLDPGREPALYRRLRQIRATSVESIAE